LAKVLDVELYVVGAQVQVEDFLRMSAFCEGIQLVDEYEAIELASV
jgi:hypothetical protein